MADGTDGGDDCLLYLVTPPAFDPTAFAGDLAAALEAGPVGAVQLRLKGVGDDDLRRAAEILLPVCRDRGVPLLLNDRPDLAAETDCDGVHVGQGDAPYAEARRLVGDDAIVGVTCKADRDLAFEAGEAGADYVAFGAFFASTTKDAKGGADPDILEFWNTSTTVPSVAIGGITPANCAPPVSAGTDFLAVVSAVWAHPEDDGGPAAACSSS